MTFLDHRTPRPAAVPPAAHGLPGSSPRIVAPGGPVTLAVEAGRGELDLPRSGEHSRDRLAARRLTIHRRLMAVPAIFAAVLAARTLRGAA